MRRLLPATFLALIFPLAAGAQSSSALVQGRITDADSGSPLAGVAVVVQRGSRQLGAAVTDADGRFRLPSLAPGTARLEASLQGYLSVVEELSLEPRAVLDLVVALHPAGIAEEVTVRDVAPAIDPQRTATSHLVSRATLEENPPEVRYDVPRLAENLLPGAVLGHDNFVHVRGNELSLHQFINGVSFLDNPHQHFSAGASPEVFESANLVTGGFRAEFGNRFGGILDITTREGADLGNRGELELTGGSVGTVRGSAEYGGQAGGIGYYVHAGADRSYRALNPPQPDELHDEGRGSRATGQLDFTGTRSQAKLLVFSGRSRLELPNTSVEQQLGRDARREIDSNTGILSWQNVLSADTLLTGALYGRSVADDVRPTTDPGTTFAEARRRTRTAGLKLDGYYTEGQHHLKGGVDRSSIRLREDFAWDPRELLEEGQAEEAFGFSGRDDGGVLGIYAQDHVTAGHLTLDLGVRYDRADLVTRHDSLSPRLGLAWELPGADTVLRLSYSRLFTPPPIEYLLLSSHLGSQAENGEPVGPPKPYEQDLYELGLSRQLVRRLVLDLSLYRHTGDNSFENSEIGNSRVFVPTNFAEAEAWGSELGLVLRPIGERGFDGRLDYTLAEVRFIGPLTGGLADEALEPGERIPPAFDQRHTVKASLFYHLPWRRFRAGAIVRYGSGTPTEMTAEIDGEEVDFIGRLPSHLTFDLSARLDVVESAEHRIDLEVGVTDLGDDRYAIAKESEVTPIQYSRRRAVSATARVSF